MNDFAWVGCEMFRIANYAVIETRTNRNQHITVLHRHVSFIGAMHTWHTNKVLTG